MYKEKIVNVLTGEETWREYTAQEIKEVEAAEIERQKLLQVEVAKATEKAAAQAKLAALGLTTDDLKALGL